MVRQMFSIVLVAGTAAFAEDVVFSGAPVAQSVIDQKDKWFNKNFSWADARGYEIYSPTQAGLEYGYGYLTLPASWDDEEVSAEKTYLVKNNLSVPCAPTGTSTTFNGRRITFGEYSETDRHTTKDFASDMKQGWLTPQNGTVTFANEGAFFVNGGLFAPGAFAPTFAGKITVQSPESNPFWLFAYSWSNPTITFDADIAAAAGTAMRASIQNSPQNYITYNFNGDLSQYFGLLSLGKNARVYFGNKATYLPGKLKLAEMAVVQPSGTGNTGSLRFGTLETTATDTVVNLGIASAAYGSLRVDDAVTVPEGATVAVKYTFPVAKMMSYVSDYWRMQVTNDVYRTFSLVDLPASFPSITSLFSLKNASASSYTSVEPELLLAVTQAERTDGTRRTYDVVMNKCTYLTVAKPSGSPFLEGAGDKWWGRSAADPIDAQTAYYVPYETECIFPKQDYVCPAARVVVAQSANMRQYADLTIEGGLTLCSNSRYILNLADQNRESVTLAGNLTFPRTPAYDQGLVEDNYYGHPVYFNGERTINVSADIHGDGVVSFMNPPISWGYPKTNITFRLSGDNRDFCGRMMISHDLANDGYYTEVCAGGAANLGGGTVGKNGYKAIELKAGGRLVATDSFAFSTATHGVYVNGKGTIGVANVGDVFALDTQLTMNGELTKIGPGTLALGGALRFTSAEDPDPATDLNIVKLEEGALRGLNKGAADGLHVRLFPGAAIEIASPTETISADETAYGFYNVKGYLNCGETENVLNVRLSERGRYDADGNDLWPDTFTRAVCTVANDTVGELEGNISLVGRPRGVKLTGIEAVANADDETTTFVASFKRVGFAIIVR